MSYKCYTVTLDDLIGHFLPTPPATKSTVPNLFASVPAFETERAMYDHFTSVFNQSRVFHGQKFVTTISEKPDTNDTTPQAIYCGMYPIEFSPTESQTSTRGESDHADWSRIDLCIVCKVHSTNQDPFEGTEPEDHYEAHERTEILNKIHSRADFVFRHQHRTFLYMLLLFSECARVIRSDRSNMVVTEKLRYDTHGAKLSHVLAGLHGSLIGSLDPKDWGHDPTAVRVEETEALHARVHEYAEKSVDLHPDDHAAELFKASLVDSWPIWKLKVYDEETDTDHWFAVGKPHFQAHGVTGRGTRGYVALPLDDDTQLPSFDDKGRPTKRYVYLKDAWRIHHPSLQKEGLVLRTLNSAKVQYVPTVVFHGDLPGRTQTTLSYDVWKGIRGEDEQCPLKSHRHYRLVVKEVGKPLHEFGRGLDFVVAILDVIRAHEQACKAGYIHRDISAGNILLYQWKSDGVWRGMLNDWEMAAAYPYPANKSNPGDSTASAEFPALALERPGTWQFLSVNCLLSLSRRKPREIADDLESIFHVLLYIAVRFLPHNITHDEAVRVFVHRYFDDCSPRLDGTATCGPAKHLAVTSGRIPLGLLLTGRSNYRAGRRPEIKIKNPFDVLRFYQYAPRADDEDGVSPPQHPIHALLYTLLKYLKDFYALSISDGSRKGERTRAAPSADSNGHSVDLEKLGARDPVFRAALVRARAKAAAEATADREVASGASSRERKVTVDPGDAARANMTHDAFMKVFVDCLLVFGWPNEDKGHDKLGRRPLELETRRETSTGTTSPAASTAALAPAATGTGTKSYTRTEGAAQVKSAKRKKGGDGGGQSDMKRRRTGGDS